MSDITIIRHAPTEYNIKEIFMGSLDIPSIEISQKDIRDLKNKIAFIEDIPIYSSPLKRAAYTASLLKNKNQIIFDKRLRERGLGEWEGMYKKDVKTFFESAFINDILNFYFLPPNGEDYKDVIFRVSDFLIEIFEKENKAIIVTHNGVFRVIKSLITGEGLSNVFSQFEPFLVPQTFILDEKIIKQIKENPLYTVDI